jgi:hypothetical protein
VAEAVVPRDHWVAGAGVAVGRTKGPVAAVGAVGAARQPAEATAAAVGAAAAAGAGAA